MSKNEFLSLNGEWDLYYVDPGVGEDIGLHREEEPHLPAIPASVPGEVHLDLKRAGKIPDPYYGRNAELCRWMDEKDWWYRRRFKLDRKGKKVFLIFKGLDTFATVYLNGRKIGEHENMHYPAVFDITDEVRIGSENLLSVKLGSPKLESWKRAGEPLPVWNTTYERLYTRKAEMGYGWDWAPPIMPTGIYRDVLIELVDSIRIDDIFVKSTLLDEGKAEVEIELTLTSFLESERELLFKFEASCEDSLISGEHRLKAKPGENRYRFCHLVEDPKLWFPWNIGRPYLYDMKAEVLLDGEVADEMHLRFGIREVKLVRYSDESPNGRVFYFTVNGIKVWAKGANWVPPDLFYPAITEDRYRRVLQMAIDGNMNMIRVWGGGIVESDLFYDLCDEMGLMVWQDFLFACGVYPEDDHFVDLVRPEAEYMVRHLRNHPSIVLWCGNNENEVLAESKGLDTRDHRIFYHLLPEICSELDPTRPYHPGSPSGGEWADSPEEGDRHNWDVWFGYKDYRKISDQARFMSEFGCQAPPCYESLLKFFPPDKIWPINDEWQYHMMQIERMIYWSSEFGPPRNVIEFIRAAQLAQATILKHYVEHYRRLKFINGGVLVWDLVAPCPNISWSLIDYYLCPKMAYYELKRAFSEVLVSIKPETEEWFSLWISNGRLSPLKGELLIQLRNFPGKIKLEERLEVKVKENGATKVGEVNANPEDVRTDFLYVRFFSDGRVLSENRHFFTQVKDLAIPETNLGVKLVSRSEKTADVRIYSDGYARLVQLKFEGDAEPISYSDNFFDLINGDGRTINIKFDRPVKTGRLVITAQNADTVYLDLGR